MATELKFVQFVHEQSGLGPDMSFRKMFGEYGFYLGDKLVALACDNALFVKPTQALERLGLRLPTRPPYSGAKPYAVADELLDEPTQLARLLIATADLLPAPKAKPAPRKPAKGRP
jgi:TfoX/Sxy family transcriptional regulator of competence genes